MSDAPERICTSQCGKTLVHDGMKRFETDVEYIRADHVYGRIAAAYVDAANLHQSLWRETSAYKTDQILKRTPNDARAALDALLKAERERALREALQRIADLKRGHSEDVDEGHEQAYRAIEALISEDATDG